jgi:hypothetical protein
MLQDVLGGSKLVQLQRFSGVFSNAMAMVVHAPQVALRPIKVLRCSQPIQRNRFGVIPRNASFTTLIKLAERVLPVSAALPSALARHGNPLLLRACTSEWLPPRFYKRLDLPGNSERPSTML